MTSFQRDHKVQIDVKRRANDCNDVTARIKLHVKRADGVGRAFPGTTCFTWVYLDDVTHGNSQVKQRQELGCTGDVCTQQTGPGNPRGRHGMLILRDVTKHLDGVNHLGEGII
ncbi:hypothetical protein Bbelb_294670 [Branchiostoma belcheri]|nr:hypothetical protein Bbelb_294670 [Branchiostoma belcheri]